MVQLLDGSPITMGNISHLECLGCGTKYTLPQLKERFGSIFQYSCEFCFNAYEVHYDMGFAASKAGEILQRPQGYWQVRELLPVNTIHVDPHRPYTPLVRANTLSNELGIELYLKLDSDQTVNPTGTFKDRPDATAINAAIESGYNEVWVASTGNLAVATARYAREYGMKIRVLIPENLGERKRQAILQYLADPKNLEFLKGPYDEANRIVLEEWQSIEPEKKSSIFIPNVSFRPFYKEGSKTNGMEIAFQLQQLTVDPEKPVKYVYPIGSGALFVSAYKGDQELAYIGLTHRPVSMWGVQAEKCAPVINTLQKGKVRSVGNDDTEEKWSQIDPIKNPDTVAKSIAIGNPGSGYHALDVIERSGGGGWVVSERDIVHWVLKLYETEGIFGQDVAGVTLAGIYQGVRNGEIKPGELVVANITGTGHGRFEDDLKEYGYAFGFAPRVDSLLKSIGFPQN